jgi:YD repeat-containing protein
LGKAVLERRKNGTENVDTYYAFDDYGRLAWVISPQGSAQLRDAMTLTEGDNVANHYCYIYRYDGRSRQISRKIPGKGVEYLVYDKLGRLVMQQDAVQRPDNKWTYWRYDDLNRVTLEAIVKGSLSQTAIQTRFDSPSFTNRYGAITQTNFQEASPFQDNSFELVCINSEDRYDDYDYHYTRTVFEEPQNPIVYEGEVLKVDMNKPYDGSLVQSVVYNLSTYDILCKHLDDANITYYQIYPPYNTMIRMYKLIDGDDERYTLLDNCPCNDLLGELSYRRESGVFHIPYYLDFDPVASVVESGDIKQLKGMKMYEKRAVFSGEYDTPDAAAIERAYYYDEDGRVRQVVERNVEGAISRTSFRYDFAGNILEQYESHRSNMDAPEDILVRTFNYGHRGRLLSDSNRLNGSALSTVDFTYDDLGRLQKKNYGGKISETYSYNLQGWLTEQHSYVYNYQNAYYGWAVDSTLLYNQQLHYYDLVTGSTPLYNGNISEWSSQQSQGRPTYLYGYRYDGLNRLTSATYHDNNGGIWRKIDDYSLRDMRYDLNGNITYQERNVGNASSIQRINYSYTGNQLSGLSGDYTGGYLYDANGNMTKDGRKGLDIQYNYLNLVSRVSRKGHRRLYIVMHLTAVK